MYAVIESEGAATAAAPAPPYARHMLVWLTVPGWHTVVAAARPHHKAALRLWQAQDWPVVVRRMEPDAAPDEICLGLPLPPDAETGEKMRVSLRARAGHVARSSPAIELKTACSAAGKWGGRLSALERDADGLDLRVYGSLAMQALTGLLYTTPASDIDVLFQPTSRRQLAYGVTLLSRHADFVPLDGEIVFPGGHAVSWKEWHMAMAHPAKVIVKHLHSVRLADTASLLATLEP